MDSRLFNQMSNNPYDVILAVFFLIFATTYLTTTMQAYQKSRHSDSAREPLIVPYGVPFLGNLLSYMIDSHQYLIRLTSKYGYSPFRLRIGPIKFFFISSPDHIADIFRTAGVTGSHKFTLLAIQYMFGCPKHVVKSAYARDNSGLAPKPLPGTSVPPEKRFFYLHHRLVLKQLSGNSLNEMTARFLDNLDREFRAHEIGDEWTPIPDLYAWLEKAVFRSSIESLCGSRIFEICPNIVEEYRDYYSVTPAFLKFLPRVLAPAAHRKRDKILKSLKKWHQVAQQNNPLNSFGQEEERWDEWWGTQFVKQRKALVLAMDGMTEDGMASDDLALVLTANVNAIPSVGWLVIDILRDPALFARVLPEAESAFLPSEGDKKRLDIVTLCNSPLLQSVYAETLRIRTANMLPRIFETGEQPLKGWMFPKKSVMFILGNIVGFDKKVWNVGNEEDPHPVEEFWADRFLIYPNNPRSGPLRNPVAEITKDAKQESGSKENIPRFSTTGLTGAWIPYGGGNNMCPGRHFAKQELIGTFAMLCAHFDLEILTPAGFKLEPDTRYRMFGAMPVKGKIPARVRRRLGA